MKSTPEIAGKPSGPLPNPLAGAPANSTAKLGRAAVAAAVLVVVGALAGLLPRWHHSAALRAETRQLAQPIVNIVSPVPEKPAAALSLPAEVKPYLEAPIYSRGSGYLKRWLVDIGAQVKEGDLLAEVDTPELNQELAQARAQLAQAQAALDLAKTTAARWAELLTTASVSEQEAAEKRADLELKQANVEAARANVRRLEDLQSFESIRAPFAGTITARNTDVGQLISAGSSKELFRLAQTGTLRVYVRVPETAAHSVVPGQKAEFSVPEMPGRTFPAKVVRTSGAMSADSRTLLTELEADNSRGEILAGTYAQVRFTDAQPEAALTLPSNTLLFRAEGPQVGVVNADGRVELRRITLGRDFGPTFEVLSGVAPGDRIILNPSDALVSGMTVGIAQAAEKTAANQ
ncbi:MAG TPA: efflux RND transporter periplasmic adaptor subunit [Candidatus Acidoferrum sp.]|jgi:membrane fusion protein (multidrug efflux system)|nr:efflux RND transporter periplasmic adaptor subunit [Candidatus Acidoferrum sp.]